MYININPNTLHPFIRCTRSNTTHPPFQSTTHININFQPIWLENSFNSTIYMNMNMCLKSSDFVNTKRKGNLKYYIRIGFKTCEVLQTIKINVLMVEFGLHFYRALYKFYMNLVLSHFLGIHVHT